MTTKTTKFAEDLNRGRREAERLLGRKRDDASSSTTGADDDDQDSVCPVCGHVIDDANDDRGAESRRRSVKIGSSTDHDRGAAEARKLIGKR